MLIDTVLGVDGIEIFYLVLLIATFVVITGVSVFILFRLFTGQR